MFRKYSKLMIALLILSIIIVGCSPGQSENGDKVEEDTSESGEVKNEDKLDFEGRQMNVVATSEAYKELFDKFGEETNSKIEFLSMSSGEVISRIKAEGGEPMADLWFGGGIDAFMAAKDDGILEQYEPEGADNIKEGFRDKDNYWISKGITVVGFLVNDEILKEKGLEVPKTWEELADPKYRNEVIMSSPAVSGTNYGAVKGILDLKGEEEGWAYWEKLNDNIPFYGKRGKDPQEKTVAGEFAIGIIPADKSAFDIAEDEGLTVIYPEDGIPWVPEGVAIFKNSKAIDIAKAFEDYILKPEIQELIAELDGKDGGQMIIEGAGGFELGLPEDQLIDEDLSTFGSERDEILEKWSEVTGDNQ